MKKLILLVITIAMLGITACSGATTPTAEPTVQDTTMADEAMADEAMADEAMAEPDMDHADAPRDDMAEGDMADDAIDEAMMGDSPMAELAAWQTLPLTDARTGETFTLGDFAGKTVFVEPMATWCTNCRQQLTNVKQARTQLNPDEVVFIGLSVETNIGAGDLAQYADNLGFDWTFAVMTPEVLQALADDFGRTITNPPSTPHFVISPDGTVSELITGIQSADEIAALTAN